MHGVSLRIVLAEAKIYHFNAAEIVALEKHEILRLDVPMRNLLGMQIFKRCKQLVHDQGRNIFRQMLLFNNVIEKFTAITISIRIISQ